MEGAHTHLKTQPCGESASRAKEIVRYSLGPLMQAQKMYSKG